MKAYTLILFSDGNETHYGLVWFYWKHFKFVSFTYFKIEKIKNLFKNRLYYAIGLILLFGLMFMNFLTFFK